MSLVLKERKTRQAHDGSIPILSILADNGNRFFYDLFIWVAKVMVTEVAYLTQLSLCALDACPPSMGGPLGRNQDASPTPPRTDQITLNGSDNSYQFNETRLKARNASERLRGPNLGRGLVCNDVGF